MESPRYVVRIIATNKYSGTPLNGTGFIVDKLGHVVTCWHVVSQADEITVQLPYTEPWKYQIYEKLEDEDIVVLESIVPPSIETPNASLHSDWKRDNKPGDAITVWGYSAPDHYTAPQRFDCTISGFSEKYGRIGLNGDVNFGDSGGPVVDADGKVIGIAQARDQNRSGQAMVIPISLLFRIFQPEIHEQQTMDSKNVTGGIGLPVGLDVSIGDITGQLAIGEYITQFMIKEPSGEALVKLIAYLEQKRQEKVNIEILNSYNHSSLPYFGPRVKEFVTTNRVEELNKALMYLQDHRLLLLTGIGGVGKTTLARALIDIRPANVPVPFWFDFRLNQSTKLGDILEKLAAYMNSPDIAKFREEKREPEKKDIDKLTDKLQAGNPVWLIFDNLETILDDVYFHDEDMDLFFTCLLNSTHQARIIITSRTFPKLKDGKCLIDVIEGEKQNIKGLRKDFAVNYLIKNGLGDLKPDKLEELATGVDGHPLALNLLVELVKDCGVDDILEDLSVYKEQKKDTILKARKFFEKLVGDEKGLLERISVYREPVEMKGLKKMFMETTSPIAIKRLIDKSLLETDHNRSYWLHPLVQEFAYDDLENKIEAHRFAMEYYLSLPLPEIPQKKEDIQPLIEAYYHAYMAKEYDQAYRIVFDNGLQEKFDRCFNNIFSSSHETVFNSLCKLLYKPLRDYSFKHIEENLKTKKRKF